MDGLGWRSPWRINQHGEDESFIESDDDMFSSIQLHIAKTGLIHAAMNSNSERSSHIHMANQLATAANIAAVAKLGVSTDWTDWADSLSTDLNSNYSIPSPLMTGFHGNRYGGVSISNNSVSLESFDCYSNTDDCEDEGIKNLWSNISGISSGYSVTKEAVDETISYCSSEKRAIFSNDQGHQIGFSDHDQRKSKKPRSEKTPSSSNINFKNPNSSTMDDHDEPDSEAIAQMKEMIYRAAAFRPVNFGEEAVNKPKRKNVRVSRDPQTVAARQRREKISEKIRVLQKMVPGGNKMDTASMLDEAANYLKFLISQVKELEKLGSISTPHSNQIPFSLPDFNHSTFPMHAQYFPHNIGSIHHHQEKR